MEAIGHVQTDAPQHAIAVSIIDHKQTRFDMVIHERLGNGLAFAAGQHGVVKLVGGFGKVRRKQLLVVSANQFVLGDPQ